MELDPKALYYSLFALHFSINLFLRLASLTLDNSSFTSVLFATDDSSLKKENRSRFETNLCVFSTLCREDAVGDWLVQSSVRYGAVF